MILRHAAAVAEARFAGVAGFRVDARQVNHEAALAWWRLYHENTDSLAGGAPIAACKAVGGVMDVASTPGVPEVSIRASSVMRLAHVAWLDGSAVRVCAVAFSSAVPRPGIATCRARHISRRGLLSKQLGVNASLRRYAHRGHSRRLGGMLPSFVWNHNPEWTPQTLGLMFSTLPSYAVALERCQETSTHFAQIHSPSKSWLRD